MSRTDRDNGEGVSLRITQDGLVPRLPQKGSARGLSRYRWPDDLGELAPTYLSQALLDRMDPDGAPGPNRLIVLVADVDPRADPPERIAAYSVQVTCDPTGESFRNARRWVLLLNGQIEIRDAVAVEAELGRSLE